MPWWAWPFFVMGVVLVAIYLVAFVFDGIALLLHEKFRRDHGYRADDS